MTTYLKFVPSPKYTENAFVTEGRTVSRISGDTWPEDPDHAIQVEESELTPAQRQLLFSMLEKERFGQAWAIHSWAKKTTGYAYHAAIPDKMKPTTYEAQPTGAYSTRVDDLVQWDTKPTVDQWFQAAETRLNENAEVAKEISKARAGYWIERFAAANGALAQLEVEKDDSTPLNLRIERDDDRAEALLAGISPASMNDYQARLKARDARVKARRDAIEAEYKAKEEAAKAARQAQREAARQEKQQWIQEHGSERLRKAAERGYDAWAQYVAERAQQEFGAIAEANGHRIYVDPNNKYEWRQRGCPTEKALATEEAIAKHLAATGQTNTKVRTVWVTQNDNDYPLESEAQYEAIAVTNYLDGSRDDGYTIILD